MAPTSPNLPVGATVTKRKRPSKLQLFFVIYVSIFIEMTTDRDLHFRLLVNINMRLALHSQSQGLLGASWDGMGNLALVTISVALALLVAWE